MRLGWLILVVATTLGCSGLVGDAESLGSADSRGPASGDPRGGAAGSGGAAGPGGSAPPSPGGFEPLRSCALVAPLSAASFDNLPAAPGSRLRVQARIGAGQEAAAAWIWTVTYVAVGQQPATLAVTPVDDQASMVDVPIEQPGVYIIEAEAQLRDGRTCAGHGTAYAQSIDGRLGHFRVRVTPPAGAKLPVQELPLQVVARAPARQTLVLQRGSEVALEPQDEAGAKAIASYVRVSQDSSDLALEGYTGWAPFRPLLLPPLEYDVLIVPERDVAPARFRGRPAMLGAQPLRLGAGAAVSGRALDADGVPVRDARVVLRSGVLTSTVGTSDGAGAFSLRAREGKFAVVISPPPGSGLLEAQVPLAAGLMVSGAPLGLEFRWAPLPRGRLGIVVRTPDGAAAARARVHIERDPPAAEAGTLVVREGDRPLTIVKAEGVTRIVATTGSDGRLDLPQVPRGRYRVTVVPPDQEVQAALTSVLVDVSSADAEQVVDLGRKARLRGRVPWSEPVAGLSVVATPRSVDPSRPAAIGVVQPDGSYTLDVDPGREVLVWVDPGTRRDLPRTFIARLTPGSSGAMLPERAQPAVLRVDGRVTDQVQSAVAGALVQVFCVPTAGDCWDPTVPLVAALSDGQGQVSLAVPDPGAP